MQLVGNIEDLGLGEILQIVSFSRKSGTLMLNSHDREGNIVFKNGQVIRAAASTVKEGVCDILVKEKAVSPAQLARAKETQKAGGYQENLGSILVKDGVPSQVIEDKASKYIEKIIYTLFLWYEGNFIFELGDFIETPEILMNDPVNYTLTVGMNPQFLAMEGTRLLDEFRREGKTPAELEPPRQEAVSEPEAETEASLPQEAPELRVLVVDDDPLTRGLIQKQLTEIGYRAEAFARPDAVLLKVRELSDGGECPVVVADMFMPRMDGEGMLGGIELLSHLKKDFPDIPVIITSEYPDHNAEKEVMDLRAFRTIAKPRRVQVKEDASGKEVVSFLKSLANALAEVGKHGEKQDESKYIMQDYLEGMEEGGFLEAGDATERTEESPGLKMLKEMLAELSRPLSIHEVVLLILRFSSEIMNRAVVFAVKKDVIAGLGQYGIEIKGEVADKRVRKMKLPLNEPSILTDAIETRSAAAKSLDPLPWNDYIVRELGGHRPLEAFVAPVIVQGKVVMLLYGDNCPDGGKIGDVSTLEIFLAQASMALERMVLEKRLSGGEAEH